MSIILRVGAVKSSRVQEIQLGSGDESSSSSSYTDADVLDIPLPEHTYQRQHPPGITHSCSTSGYFGLPYQDHNYGLPPPPSPSHSVSPQPPSPLQVSGFVQIEDEIKTTPLVSVVEEVVEDSTTRCICGYLHDDGYMICCDKCSVWQHIGCMGVDRNCIPDSYLCELCQPRILDTLKAKQMQKRIREELAARSVLSESSAMDIDPEEIINTYTSMGRKLTVHKKKGPKPKLGPELRDNDMPVKMRVGKGLSEKKARKLSKNDKENMNTTKSKKIFALEKLKLSKNKSRPLLTLEEQNADLWNSNFRQWADTYEFAYENQYSPAVSVLSSDSHFVGRSVNVSSILDQLPTHLICIADVEKNRKGLRATRDIPEGQPIIDYKGRVILRHEYDKEFSFVDSFKKLEPFVLYYSKLDINVCVDAREYGNEARFVRRSCNPNSEVQHILTQGKVYFVIVSRKDVSAGSEITIPFDFNYKDYSFCVECACIRNNCVVTRYWKRLMAAQITSIKSFTVKQKHGLSNGHSDSITLDNRLSSSSPAGSQSKGSASPEVDQQMELIIDISPSPDSTRDELSSMPSPLAASVLLDSQSDVVTGFRQEVSHLFPQLASSSPLPHHKLNTSSSSSKKGNKSPADSLTEEAQVTASAVQEKVKNKNKKLKSKDKASKDYSNNREIKKERHPHCRRRHGDSEDVTTDTKTVQPASRSGSYGVESEDTSLSSDSSRKMTREERKLDAILKAFERMEKREERRKEALARGDSGVRKCSGYSKLKKKDGSCGNSNLETNGCSHPTSQDESHNGVDDVKNKFTASHQVLKLTNGADIKTGNENGFDCNIWVSIGASLASGVSTVFQEAPGPVEESSRKPLRKGKRNRRRNRIRSTTAISDAASVSTDEGSSNNSFPLGALSVPGTPALTPVCTSIPPAADEDGGFFRFMKTKKNLSEDWSSKHDDDENCKHEDDVFVQCLPNTRVNTVDHLQRKSLYSGACSVRGMESGAGSAKKRWLCQALHEVPAYVIFNKKFTVSTESSRGSPLHSGINPDPATCIESPGAGSPKSLDLLTPLKKRRLTRELLSAEADGPVDACPDILAENFISDGAVVIPKMSVVK